MSIRVLFLCIFYLASSHVFADDKQVFKQWLSALKQEAIADGISKNTVNLTFKKAKLISRVIALDRAQPEFISTYLAYLDKRVNASVVEKGRMLQQEHQVMLDAVQARYGVPKQVLVSFWGMETHFGRSQGDFDLPSALMTLAYEGRRADFFRTELMHLMHIIDAQHHTATDLRGSWAGAMGQMQFMPSTFLNHGVDADLDGRINIWTSLPDAFSSAANYLAKSGWHADEPVAIQVKLPKNFNYALAQLNVRKSVAAWSQLGVEVPSFWLDMDNTAILLPQGWQGPAMMVFSNFDVIMQWNRSVNYALAVSNLADQLAGEVPVTLESDLETDALSFNQIWALQGKLNELGFDCGKPDGFPGLKTQEAIRLYQASQQLPQDGYASPSLYHRLLEN
ncbi:MAG: lytic murein transglycosylase [Methylophilus sp.]|nr:lytic murein transglycosylase [Methylophilus sp.]